MMYVGGEVRQSADQREHHPPGDLRLGEAKDPGTTGTEATQQGILCIIRVILIIL